MTKFFGHFSKAVGQHDISTDFSVPNITLINIQAHSQVQHFVVAISNEAEKRPTQRGTTWFNPFILTGDVYNRPTTSTALPRPCIFKERTKNTQEWLMDGHRHGEKEEGKQSLSGG